ncbi:MAG: VapC toxin family PIN domain ribonuclease [Streptomyces sp.]|nr:VapC toxin family PIN domain ribonuclease [Streptomyces sp.]
MTVAVYLIDTSALGRLMKRPTRVLWEKPLEDRAGLIKDLDALFGWTPLDDRAVTRAWDVQRNLIEKGQHRSAGAVDLLVAATAELQGLTMLHYGNDFETIASVTGQPTQWLAPPGGL